MQIIISAVVLLGLVSLFFISMRANSKCVVDYDVEFPEECATCDSLFCSQRKDKEEIKNEMKAMIREGE